MTKLYRSRKAASFRAAWHGAVELAKRRKAERGPTEYVGRVRRRRRWTIGARYPTGSLRRGGGPGKRAKSSTNMASGRTRNRYRSRGEEANDRIGSKLLRIRRMFLQEISASPGKRAAFEILTELPIDWDSGRADRAAARRALAQHQPAPARHGADRRERLARPQFVHGPDRKAELLRDMNEWRAERELPAVGWKGEGRSGGMTPISLLPLDGGGWVGVTLEGEARRNSPERSPHPFPSLRSSGGV